MSKTSEQKKQQQTNKNTEEENDEKINGKKLNGFMRYSSMAFQMGATVFLGVFGGIQADKFFGLEYTFTVILSILGVFVAVYFAVKDFI